MTALLAVVVALPAQAAPGEGLTAALQGGSWSHSVPLDLPPAPAGMVPGLALAHDFRLPDGLLGPGWALSGLSRIDRAGEQLTGVGAATVELGAGLVIVGGTACLVFEDCRTTVGRFLDRAAYGAWDLATRLAAAASRSQGDAKDLQAERRPRARSNAGARASAERCRGHDRDDLSGPAVAMAHHQRVRADLPCGALRLSLSVVDYAYGGKVTGSDADWLRMIFELETPEFVATKSCMMLAGELPALRGALARVDREPLEFENTERDFRLTVEAVADGFAVKSAVRLTSGGTGSVAVSTTASLDAIQIFLSMLDDLIAVYPPRG